MNKSLRGKAVPGRRRGQRALAARLTVDQQIVRFTKIAKRATARVEMLGARKKRRAKKES